MCDLLPDSEGKNYLLSLLGVKEKEVAKEAVEETKEAIKEAIQETKEKVESPKEIEKQPDTFIQKVAASPVVAPKPYVKRENKPRNLPKFDMTETRKDFESIGTSVGGMLSGMRN